MRVQDIIRRPLVTEKALMANEQNKVMAFEVDRRATKIEIRRAVETQFEGAKVAQVRVVKMHGKLRRQGRFVGRKPDWKKAYVTLAEDSKPIEIFEGV